MTTEQVWVGVGLLGQALFSARFIVQWIASERRKQSVVPAEFWYLSLAGALITLSYAVYRLDPVFILGYTPGLFIYARNLYFIHRRV
ncbi:MAG: lipid A biosynthesis protein [Candidatus Rokubacteria bacterium]|nr:lipid A biosynthesis protein [Candidatus Rokubacteria bacterium]